MISSSQQRSDVYLIAESTYGTTPTSPAFSRLRRARGGMRTSHEVKAVHRALYGKSIPEIVTTLQVSEGGYAAELTYGTFDSLIEAALGGTWSSNVVHEGTTERSFTIEEVNFLSTGAAYRRFNGCKIESLGFSLQAGGLVKVNLELVGISESLGTSILSGATYSEPNTNPIEPVANATVLGLSGLSANPTIMDFNLTIKNNLHRIQNALSLNPKAYAVDKAEISGSFSAFFETTELYQAVLSRGTSPLSITVGTTTNKKYTLALAKAHFSDAETLYTDRNGPLVAKVAFRALYGTANSVTITRNVA